VLRSSLSLFLFYKTHAASRLHLTTAFGGASPQGEALYRGTLTSPSNSDLSVGLSSRRFNISK
jgi:hypothetical protein